MNIDQALEEVKSFLDFADEDEKWAWSAYEAIQYTYEFAKTVRTVPTTHDSQAEGESWDKFFEDRKKAANGKS